MPTRISGKVYGDLTGSIFEPQVKSIANVDSGTLPIAHGGTGLNLPGASGSALVSDGTSLVYAVIGGGGGGVTAGEVSGAIDQLTSSLSSSYVQNTILNDYALKSGTIFTGAVTASSGVSASLIRFPDGSELTSSTDLGGGLSSVYTDGNITGSGLIGDKIGLKDNITLTSVTASLFGTSSYSSQALSASYASTVSGQLRLITGAERATITPTVGLMIYQTDTSGSDTDGVYVYKSIGWVQMI